MDEGFILLLIRLLRVFFVEFIVWLYEFFVLLGLFFEKVLELEIVLLGIFVVVWDRLCLVLVLFL